MTRKQPKLTPLPKRKAPAVQPARSGRQATDSRRTADDKPDLSRLAEDLRPLAWPLDQLQFHPANPRKHDEESIAGIRASLRVNDQYKPILASTRTEPPTVICGNGTLSAALAEGWTHLAVVRKKLTEAQENQIAIIDNRSAELSDWEDENLERLLKDVDTANDEDLDRLMSELAADRGLIPEDEDQGANPPASRFNVMVECPNQEAQDSLFDRLTKDGLKCRKMAS